jgi:hypothetical protein
MKKASFQVRGSSLEDARDWEFTLLDGLDEDETPE